MGLSVVRRNKTNKRRLEEVMSLFENTASLSVGWVTLHFQKDGRINLGTAVHSTPHCSALKGRTVHDVQGEIVPHLPVCKHCKLHSN